jgi:hypothetical protein
MPQADVRGARVPDFVNALQPRPPIDDLCAGINRIIASIDAHSVSGVSKQSAGARQARISLTIRGCSMPVSFSLRPFRS